jgi:alpha-1,2-mannosyltransferase
VYGLRLLADPRLQRAILVVLAGVLVLYRAIALLDVEPARWGFDFAWYWGASSNLLHGLPIYSAQQLAGPYSPQGQEGFLYPPPLAALVIPLALVFPTNMAGAGLVWSVLGAVAAGAGLLLIVRTDRLGERYPLLAGSGVALLLVAAFALPPVIDEFINGNVHLFLVALLAAAWWGVARSDASDGADARGDRVAGIAVGIATVIKLFPGVLVLWFLLTGRRRAAGWSVVGAVALTLVTLPLTGIQPWLDYPRVLANLGAPIDATNSMAPTIWLAPWLGFTVARVVVTVIGLGVVVWAAHTLDARRGFALTVAVAVLVTPALWSHYLTVLLVPLTLALGAGVSLAWLAVVYVLLSAQKQAGLGDYAWITIRAMPTAGALLLAGVLGRKR